MDHALSACACVDAWRRASTLATHCVRWFPRQPPSYTSSLFCSCSTLHRRGTHGACAAGGATGATSANNQSGNQATVLQTTVHPPCSLCAACMCMWVLPSCIIVTPQAHVVPGMTSSCNALLVMHNSKQASNQKPPHEGGSASHIPSEKHMPSAAHGAPQRMRR